MRGLGLMVVAYFGVSSAAVGKDPPKPAEDRIICKRQQDADTGSHFASTKRVCLRKSEWEQLEDGAENSLRRLRQQGGACPKCLVTGSGGGPG